ncbi:MAG: tetratricopeptide repeat protein [Bacteroidetes bacterium]|nr:tetratricopeptide repeat protein [Bacteroidota bacterium]
MSIKHFKKAGSVVCFFLSTAVVLAGPDQLWQFSDKMQEAYRYVLNLQPDKAKEVLDQITSPAEELHKIYLLSLSETVDILITEDQKRFDILESNFSKRLQHIDQLSDGPDKLFLKSELSLQLGFNLLNLGQNLNAVLSIRRAYNAALECIKKYPTYIPIKKTYGVLQVMIGSVPDKYHWFMSLLGMKGSVTTGQKQLQELKDSKSSLSIEATILYFTVKGFINQQFAEAAVGLTECLKDQPDSRLILFLSINMLMKDAQSAKALEAITALENHNQGLQMYYIEYLKGEALLNKGDYENAIAAYQKFLKGYRSQSFLKDAHFKIAMCYWLLNDETDAKLFFEKAKTVGREQADPDKYAAAQLLENKFPNKKILKLRFSTDGGYYKEAHEDAKAIQFSELKTLKEKTEYFYRLARLAHKTEEYSVAKIYYEETIALAKENPWYFAPNAALQLGYIYREQKDFVKAKKYFELAITYKRHEYKNSIDSKSRSALDQLKAAKV